MFPSAKSPEAARVSASNMPDTDTEKPNGPHPFMDTQVRTRTPRFKISHREVNLEEDVENQGPTLTKPKAVHLPAIAAKNLVRKQTGVVYDERMMEHRNIWDPNHPESPERYSAILTRCNELELLNRCITITPRSAELEEVTSVHSQTHAVLLKVLSLQCRNVMEFEEFAEGYNEVYLNAKCHESALLAAGSTIDLVKSVAEGKLQNGLAIVRPPGHNAMEEEYAGYCYFNNVAIAAKQVLNSGLAKQILIVDFDIRHGQGTQRIFYDDPRVLYFSIHRHQYGTSWPYSKESNFNWIGKGKGLGYNLNIPINITGIGNTEFVTIWQKILMPMAFKFNPDLVIVSAGYNAALGCPEGEMALSPSVFPHLMWPLMALAEGKLAVVLEGGYCLKSLAEGVALTLRALLGDPCPIIPKISCPDPEVVASILSATTMLQRILKFAASSFLRPKDFDKELKNGAAFTPELRFDFKGTDLRPYNFPTRGYYNVHSEDLAQALDEELDKQIASTSLAVAKHRVGLLYDVVMLAHRNMSDPYHPETPERISDIFACHEDYGLVERCHRIEIREATHDELKLIHTEEHILKMQNTTKLDDEDLDKLQNRFDSVYLNKSSYSAALNSAGSVLQAVDSVLRGECQSVVAIIRPPGHHAEKEEPCGFCVFNNVALAAKYAIEKHHLKRILIVDWDVHHGNGIQHMFEDDPRVLYISLHRYDHGAFFPGKKDADLDVVGQGDGKGFNVNIPWNGPKMGDTEYLAAFTNIILPIAYEYGPELVLVSAGFDAAQGDPLGGYKVTPEGYAHMTNLLSPLANGRIILALEGGYNLTSVAYSMTLCTKALLGDPLPPLRLKEALKKSGRETIQRVISVQSEYWTVLTPFVVHLPLNCQISRGVYPENEDVTSNDEDIIKEFENLDGINRRTWRLVCEQSPKKPRLERDESSPSSTVDISLNLNQNPELPLRCPGCHKLCMDQLDLDIHETTCTLQILFEEISKLQISDVESLESSLVNEEH